MWPIEMTVTVSDLKVIFAVLKLMKYIALLITVSINQSNKFKWSK